MANDTLNQTGPRIDVYQQALTELDRVMRERGARWYDLSLIQQTALLTDFIDMGRADYQLPEDLGIDWREAALTLSNRIAGKFASYAGVQVARLQRHKA